VGTDSPRAIELLRALYEPFTRNRERLMVMDVRSAELTKYAANAMLATKISFINELAGIAEKVGADIEKVRQGIGSDSRIGYSFIYPGAGYGGSCFPKDVQALARTAASVGAGNQLLQAVESVNASQKRVLFDRLSSIFAGDLKGKTIAVWGLAFKPNTDDMREAPSRVLMENLWSTGARVQAYDPVARTEARRLYPVECESGQLKLVSSSTAALEGADALVIVTEWQEFRSPDFDGLRSALKHPVIVDGRNLYDPALVARHGLRYFAIGRGESVRHS
jgi:UDPglucose 6-dehydrogenase